MKKTIWIVILAIFIVMGLFGYAQISPSSPTTQWFKNFFHDDMIVIESKSINKSLDYNIVVKSNTTIPQYKCIGVCKINQRYTYT